MNSETFATALPSTSRFSGSDGRKEQPPAAMSLAEVGESLRQEGWKGFALFRHCLQLYPGECRRLARMLPALPWELRSDIDARRVRFAFVGTFSTDNLSDALWLAAMERGIVPVVYHAPFNQFSLMVRDPASPLYTNPPDIAVVAVNPADRGLMLWNNRSTDLGAAANHFIDDLMTEVSLLHERSRALVLVHNFAPPEFRPLGLLDWRQQPGIAEFYSRLNLALIERCRQIPWIHVVEVTYLSSIAGLQWPTLHQPRFMGAYALPPALALLLSREYVAVAAALKGFAKKWLAIDLDGTLWGGIVGEDGVANLQVGGGYPGNIYQELQQVIYQLYERGVILAVNSKNNENDAWEPFARRPEMVLRREHFSAWRINWRDKVTNLQELAQELGIGLDSCVVLDDNPAERAWVEEHLPEAYVVPAEDPLVMVRTLATTPLFETLNSTAEDRLRAKSYAAAAQRRALQVTATNLAEFLTQLNIQVNVHRPTESQIGRVAQLTQRTNQFNLTTHRYSHDQILEFWTSANVEVLSCEVRDKFVDEGIVGVVILRKTKEVWSIDTFLLSCRVLGRGVELALLWAVSQKAATAGARWLRGEYVQSAKNGQTEGFYREAGFTLTAAESASSHWTLALPPPPELAPAWITLTLTEEL